MAQKYEFDKAYWDDPVKKELQIELYKLSYKQKRDLWKDKKIDTKDMNEAAKYKLRCGFEQVDENGNKIEYSPMKYFDNYQWLSMSDCQLVGLDWYNTEAKFKNEIMEKILLLRRNGKI